MIKSSVSKVKIIFIRWAQHLSNICPSVQHLSICPGEEAGGSGPLQWRRSSSRGRCCCSGPVLEVLNIHLHLHLHCPPPPSHLHDKCVGGATCSCRNTEALRQMAVGPVRERDAAEPHAEVRPRTNHTGQRAIFRPEPGSIRGSSVWSPDSRQPETTKSGGKTGSDSNRCCPPPPRRWTSRLQTETRKRQNTGITWRSR